jgi:haloacetate dehalogenase
MLEGFTEASAHVDGIRIHAVKGGHGPALLLLHGHPQTHAIWHKAAPVLAEHFTVIAADLRGYGDSGKPQGAADHSNYSKRRMALDQLELMRSHGFPSFALIGHDRGGRVAARMALDHPNAVTQLVTLDVAPTVAMYEQTSFVFARAYWHWFFLVRPAPFPETLIRADPDLYLKQTMGARSAGLEPFTPEAYAAYLRCLSDPATTGSAKTTVRRSPSTSSTTARISPRASALPVRSSPCGARRVWSASASIRWRNGVAGAPV